MKKILICIGLLLLLTGCEQTNNSVVKDKDITVDAAPAEVVAPVISNPEPSVEPETEPTEPQYPILDEELTESLTTYMYESFGGSGDEQFATSWYKYIDYWEIYQNEDSYSGILHLKERPFDYSARLLLSKYYSEDELDTLSPILMDVGASLDLDDIELCSIGEALYKIKTEEDSEIYYYALSALDIPIYDFLSSGSGLSIDDVRSSIKKNKIPGKEAYKCLVDYMKYEYEGAFDGFSMEDVKYMSVAAIDNFKDVRIVTLDVVEQDDKSISTYKNQN